MQINEKVKKAQDHPEPQMSRLKPSSRYNKLLFTPSRYVPEIKSTKRRGDSSPQKSCDYTGYVDYERNNSAEYKTEERNSIDRLYESETISCQMKRDRTIVYDQGNQRMHRFSPKRIRPKTQMKAVGKLPPLPKEQVSSLKRDPSPAQYQSRYNIPEKLTPRFESPRHFPLNYNLHAPPKGKSPRRLLRAVYPTSKDEENAPNFCPPDPANFPEATPVEPLPLILPIPEIADIHEIHNHPASM